MSKIVNKKLEILLENHQDEVMNLISNLFNQKYPKPKKTKTICHFKALGNTYDNDIFVRNYIHFMDHVTSIKDYNEVKSVMSKYITEDKQHFSKKCLTKNQAIQLKTGYFINTYSPTETKVKHIKKICKDLLKCELKFV